MHHITDHIHIVFTGYRLSVKQNKKQLFDSTLPIPAGEQTLYLKFDSRANLFYYLYNSYSINSVFTFSLILYVTQTH